MASLLQIGKIVINWKATSLLPLLHQVLIVDLFFFNFFFLSLFVLL